MKKILPMMLLFVALANAQIVSVPDANFKSKLVSTNCADFNGDGQYEGDVDTNNDGEIQLSEAATVQKLKISNSSLPSPNAIVSLTGLESFVNLNELNASLNTINAFNYNLPSLRVLYLNVNNLTSIDLSGVSGLEVLDLAQNDLTSIVLSSCPNLISFSCDYNELTTLDITALPNLVGLSARFNSLTALDLTQSNNLTSLQLDGNQFTPITTNLVNLQSLGASYMGISNLDLVNNVNLTTLSLNGNLFSELNFPSLPLLNTLFCSEMSTLININVNLLPSLTYFNCVNNSQLTTLFMKNGVTAFTNLSLAENFNLQYVCVDDFNVDGIAFNLQTLNILDASVTSYCSFEPGGNFNTVTGAIFFDSNNNGCDTSDVTNSNIKINITDGINQGATFTNSDGVYVFYTQALNLELGLALENPNWFNVTPQTAAVNFPNVNNNSEAQNFCITANGVHPDLEIVVTPTVPARPGFEAEYKIVYRNKGNQTLSQVYGINFFYNQNLMSLVSASLTPEQQSAGSLSWSYDNLQPFESREIIVKVVINTPTDSVNPVNIGDQLIFTASILPQNGDETTSDNLFVLNQTVIGSYDPNDITCLEGDIVPPSQIGSYLHYNVRFENTGNAPAENIVVRIDANTEDFDVSSLQLLNASHPVEGRIRNNRIEFIFQGIMLESGGHGNVLLKVKSKSSLQEGDSVSKKANIYFDYNFPVATNDANTIFQSLSIGDYEPDHSVAVYPNPTHNDLTIKANNNLKSIELYDVQGRLLQTMITSGTEVKIFVGNQPKGIYFIKAVTDKGTTVEKIVVK